MSTTIQQAHVYAPGESITAEATAPVAARRVVKVSGNRTATGNLAVATAAAGAVALGVAANDAAAGQLVRVARGGVVRVIAEGVGSTPSTTRYSAPGVRISTSVE
ncbi:hypothetical protein [Mycobacterium sp. NAZ190054]|uniref:hypothetical protein n=1 Tax=Mycobacterium sp. NAZ190054 TaxID=1747766 RepID=UPI000B2985CC|nr:hypothetical protein [Mycobacterium sp. NAZ190054]